MSEAEMKEIRKLGVLYEAIQDNIQKLLELMGTQQLSTNKIPKMSERIEKLENDMTTVKLATMGTNSDLRLIKIRTEKLEQITDQLKDHEQRVTRLEAAT